MLVLMRMHRQGRLEAFEASLCHQKFLSDASFYSDSSARHASRFPPTPLVQILQIVHFGQKSDHPSKLSKVKKVNNL